MLMSSGRMFWGRTHWNQVRESITGDSSQFVVKVQSGSFTFHILHQKVVQNTESKCGFNSEERCRKQSHFEELVIDWRCTLTLAQVNADQMNAG